MIDSLAFGRFVPRNSFLHRLDPRTKIFASFVLITTIMLINKMQVLFAFGLLTVMMIFLSGVSLKAFLNSVKLVLFLIIFTIIAHFLFTPGQLMFKWGFLQVSREGFNQGITMSLKLFYIVSVTSLVTLTTSPMALTDGLLAIFRPFKRIGLPADELALMMVIALRFIPTIWEETDKIKKAQMSRGAQFDTGNIITRIGHMTALMVPILLSAFRRADELALAMESRAYRVGIPRTRMKIMKFSPWDYLVMVLLTAVLVVVVGYRMNW
ncbi:cobalt transport protein [Thermincola ferriacetica]|uniref:Cobalt transport protein n=1 Tax=Thermincola ferriacetica TaxID=281456 RepID=A0A0L6W303_9FIRM|nr:energy-coupling factor transporter transmembrane component T [Thermincola ferriacetica]KNZ69449.1 cobalt transport protein [Thermincola ferriacetica]